MVSNAAKSHGAHRSQGPFGKSAEARGELRELERLCRISSCETERIRLTKIIWGLRRQHKRLREAASLDFYTSTSRARAWRQRANRSAAQSLDGVDDRTTWPAFLSEYFSSVFAVTSPEHNVWRLGMIDRIRERAEEFARSPELNVTFTANGVAEAIASLKPGKASASDGVSAEMLQSFPQDAILLLAVSFSVRASGGERQGSRLLGTTYLQSFSLRSRMLKVGLNFVRSLYFQS